MDFKITKTLFTLVLTILFTSCGVKKIVPNTAKTKLTTEAKSQIQAINKKLNFYKDKDFIESQILLDSIIIIDKIPFLFIEKETTSSTEKFGFPIHDFKKLNVKKKDDSYFVEVKTKHKENKTHIAMHTLDYDKSIYQYDFIVNSTKMTKLELKALKQDFNNLIKSLQ